MTLGKREFIDRLNAASIRTADFARTFSVHPIPGSTRFDLDADCLVRTEGTQDPAGRLKLVGGRYVERAALFALTSREAAAFLWIDGSVPGWINLSPLSVDDEHFYIQVRNCRTFARQQTHPLLVFADAHFPFRIRGPTLPEGWKSVEVNGPIALPRRVQL